jgi:soluble lytic murein transglycosylase-like protein
VTVGRWFNTTLTTIALLVCAALPASAQIYSWRDATGKLILSNKKPENNAPVTSYDVRAARGGEAAAAGDDVRTTNFVPGERSEPYEDLIVEHAREHNVRPSLVRAVIQVESAFNPIAYSNKGAMGLMQLMPATAREFGVRNAFNPEQNIKAGVAYLRQLLDRYDGNEQLALAAYNAGPGAVDRYGEAVPPYRETRNYVSKVGEIAGPKRSGTKIYTTVEMVDGRPVIKLTDKKPE